MNAHNRRATRVRPKCPNGHNLLKWAQTFLEHVSLDTTFQCVSNASTPGVASTPSVSFSIVHQFFIPIDLQAQFPTRATRGAGVDGTSTYPSIPNTTVNVMRPKRKRWTSPLAKSNRPRPFIACTIYPTLHHRGLNSFFFQIHYPCLRRKLPCSIHTPAIQTLLIEHGIHASQAPPTSHQKIGLGGSLSYLQLVVSAWALPERGHENGVCSLDNL
jgi:hypothetical protein